MRVGEAMHVATLEPHRFGLAYIQRPEGSASKLEENGGCKRAYDAAKATGKAMLSAEEAFGCERAVSRIQGHPHLGKLLRLALHARVTELSCVADLDVEGEPLRVKIRLDAYVEEVATVLDLKATVDATPDGFPRQIYQYGHHRQAGLYERVLHALKKPCDIWLWAAIAKTAPHELGAYQCEEEALQLGIRENEKLLVEYAKCLRSGIWPGLAAAIQPIGLPGWAYKAAYYAEEEA
jgi:exodeoxyribonuclease VIII